MSKPIIDVNIDEHRKSNLVLDLHANFLVQTSKRSDPTLDFLKMSGIYWSLTAIDLLNCIDKFPKDDIVKFVMDCYQEDGGFSPAIDHDSHILNTLSALQILTIYNEMDGIDREKTFAYILSLKNDDGSFCGDKWGEIDTRFSFTAVASIALLGKLKFVDKPENPNELVLTTSDSRLIGDFVMSCYNYDGGFGSRPLSESHSGQVYCCLGTLSLLGQLRRVNSDLTCWWLAERQLPSGGLNGRPEKKPDVCYSWWVLSSLSILGRLSWIDSERLVQFILASQDDESGGISDRPGDMPDPYHTVFGLAGISLLQQNIEAKRKHKIIDGKGDEHSANETTNNIWTGIREEQEVNTTSQGTSLDLQLGTLKPINPVFCMPQYVIDRINVKIETL